MSHLTNGAISIFPLNIAIIGYGAAGIAAAIFLRRTGHRITHFESAPTSSNAGAGILLHPTGVKALDALGLLDKALTLGARVDQLTGETVNGRKIMDLRYADVDANAFGLGILRRTLLTLLSDADSGADQLFAAHSVDAIDSVRGYVNTSDGAQFGPFDLIVAADGSNSNARRSAPSLVLHERAYRTKAAICAVDDPDNSLQESLTQRFSGGSHISMWRAGRCADTLMPRAIVAMNLPVFEKHREPEASHWMEEARAFDPAIATLLNQQTTVPKLYRYDYRDVVMRRYYQNRLVFIGDAAHAMSPQIGHGTSMALLDAWSLSTSLLRCANVADAVARYDQARRTHVAVYQQFSRWSTPIFQSDRKVFVAFRDYLHFPLSRIPIIRRTMLNTLCGIQHGFLSGAPIEDLI